MTNLISDVRSAVAEDGERTALSYDGTDSSYEAFWGQVRRFSGALQERGFEPGDRVGLYLPNLPQYVIGFFGTLHAGGVVVPLNPQYKAREIEHLLADSETSVVVTLADLVGYVDAVVEETSVEHVFSVGEADGAETLDAVLANAPVADEYVERGDDDVAVQPYTSGTTGTPKGVLLTHENLGWDARAAAKLIPDGIAEDDRFLGVLPLFHIYGMTITMIATLFEGASYYPVPEWDADTVCSIIDREQITVMHGVPAMFNDMIGLEDSDAYDLSSLRFVNSGGSGLPIEVLEGFEATFECELYEGYGLTETSPVTHANSPGNRRPGSIGQPLEGVSARIVDSSFEDIDPVTKGPVGDDQELDGLTGELVVSGPNVMKGYAGLPDANEAVFTEADGKRWFHTGDIGYYDEDGFFYVVDREKHMINTAGYNVYPRELEELLFEHEAVADVAVVGIDDERRGETVAAFVVPSGDVTEDELQSFCLDRLAEYKHPRTVEFVEELPRTTTGKVQKFELKEHSSTE